MATVSAILETKDARIATLEQEVALLERTLDPVHQQQHSSDLMLHSLREGLLMSSPIAAQPQPEFVDALSRPITYPIHHEPLKRQVSS